MRRDLKPDLLFKIILVLCATFLLAAITIRFYHEYYDVDSTWGNMRPGVYPGWDTTEN